MAQKVGCVMEATSINEMLSKVNVELFGKDGRIGLHFVELSDVREQDINANVMPAEMFNALVSNIEKHGALESVPLVANREGSEVLEIISGHHRIRSAREAGLAGTVVLRYCDLTAGEIRAKQLAHNSIQGTSDPQIVA